jgi:ABC-2 type transport system ATP-binding protein
MPVIELTDVTKQFVIRQRAGRFRRHRIVVNAVDTLSLAIGAGELVGYIGPNGAGKSTTIKLLTGILTPSGGRVRVAGLDPQRQRITLARRVGVVFGQRSQLWWDLPLRDSFDLLRSIYRVPAARHRHNCDAFVEMLELGAFLDTPVRQLSLGQRMRGEITAALLHDPAVVYLDEPTIGLDVISKARVRDFLRVINRDRGVTIVLTTHDLDDVEALSSRLIVVDRGRIVHDGSVADTKRRYAPHRTLIVDLSVPGPPIAVPHTEVIKVEQHRQWIRFHPDQASASEIIAAIAATTNIHDLTIAEPDIEDVITRIYRREVPHQGESASPV